MLVDVKNVIQIPLCVPGDQLCISVCYNIPPFDFTFAGNFLRLLKKGRPPYSMYPNRSEQTSKYSNRNVHT